MPPGPTDLEHLSEPSALHARLSTARPLDWGERIPTKQAMVAAFGEDPTRRSLAMLTRAAEVEPQITADLSTSVPADASTYRLKNRLKSPHSLARKLKDRADYYRRTKRPVEDLFRYTVAVDHPHDLTKAAVDTVARLRARGWTMDSAHHSYVKGSRYKGLHVFLRTQGELVELQVHSRESLDVKEQTTPLYEVERDPQQDRRVRETARQTCIALSDRMTHPAGIDELNELGGVQVELRSYGKRRQESSAGPTTDTSGPTASNKHQRSQHQHHDKQNGLNR